MQQSVDCDAIDERTKKFFKTVQIKRIENKEDYIAYF